MKKSIRYIDEYGVKPRSYWDTTDFNLTAQERKDDSGIIDYTLGIVKKLIDQNPNFHHDAFFIRYAYRLYDGTITKPSPPILVMPSFGFGAFANAHLDYNSTGGAGFKDSSNVAVNMFELYAEYDISMVDGWGDIITSVDFFASNYIGGANPEDIKNLDFYRALGDHLPSQRVTVPLYTCDLRKEAAPSKDTVEELAVKADKFYLYYSDENYTTPKTGANKVKFPNNETTVKTNFYNIIHQEMMPIDTLSHHSLFASRATIYNNRLRLSGVRTLFFKGFNEIF